MFLRLLALALIAGAPIAALAQPVQQPTPVAYRIVHNNRIFLAGEDSRFVEDLHVYMRCAQFKKTGEPWDTTADCISYRAAGALPGILVPNLRSEQQYREHSKSDTDTSDAARLAGNSNEYRIRYDKTFGRFSRDYVTDGRREIELSLNEYWLADAPVRPRNCRWRIEPLVGVVQEFGSADCRPTPISVDLSLAADGKTFDYSAKVTLSFELSDGGAKSFSETLYTRDVLIVAMGDSFTSGEGNPERNAIEGLTPAQWLDYRCHRSVFSYPVIVAAALALSDPRHSVTLVDVACSGAQTTAGVLDYYEGAVSQDQARALWSSAKGAPVSWSTYGTGSKELDPQIKQAEDVLVPSGSRISRKPELLLASIGVNDVSLVGLLDKLATNDCSRACLEQLRRLRTSESLKCHDSKGAISAEGRLRRSFDCLDTLLGKMRSEIDARLEPQKVYLAEYINPLHDEAGKVCDPKKPQHKNLLSDVLLNYGAGGKLCNAMGTWCPWFPELTKVEIDYAYNEFLEPLRKSLRRVTDDARWVMVSYTDTEQQRGFCARPSWYHRFAESMARQGLNPGSKKESVGTLHPNTFGQYFVAVRMLSRMVRDGQFAGWGHNLGNMRDDRFGGDDGFAWYIWEKDKQRLGCHMYFGGNPRRDCRVP